MTLRRRVERVIDSEAKLFVRNCKAVLDEKDIEAAVEESKMVRSPTLDGTPREAIRFCFQQAHIGSRDVSYGAVISRPLPP